MLPSKRRPRDGAIDPRKDISGLGNSTRLTGPINWTKTDGIRAGAHFAPEPRDRGYGGAPRLAARGPSMAGEHDGKAPFFAVEKSRGDAAQRAFCPAPPSPPGSSRRRRASYAPPGARGRRRPRQRASRRPWPKLRPGTTASTDFSALFAHARRFGAACFDCAPTRSPPRWRSAAQNGRRPEQRAPNV